MNTVRSDDLPQLIESMRWFRTVSGDQIAMPARYHAVVDASHVIAAIRFKVKLAAPAPRVHFEELVAAGLLDVYAPNCLFDEVHKNLLDLAEEEGLPLGRMQAVWDELQSSIYFVVPSAASGDEWSELARRDPKDIPYCQVVRDVGADFLIAGDADYEDALVPILNDDHAHQGLAALKQFGRAKARELQAQGASYMPTLVAAITVVEAAKAFIRAPWWVQALVVGGAALMLSDDQRRAASKEAFLNGVVGVGEFLTEAMQAAEIAGREGELHHEKAKTVLPPPRTPTLAVAAYRCLISTGAPARLTDLEKALRAGGLLPADPGGRERLRRALLSHGGLVQDRRRRWMLRDAAGA